MAPWQQAAHFTDQLSITVQQTVNQGHQESTENLGPTNTTMPFLLSVNVPPYSEWQTRLASQHPQTRHTTLLTVIFLWQFTIISFWWTVAYCGGQFDHTMREKTVPENLWNMCVAPHFCRTLRQWAELSLVWQRVNRPIHSDCKLQMMSADWGWGGRGGEVVFFFFFCQT